MRTVDDIQWGLSGARFSAPLMDAESICETPLVELLRRSAARQADKPALVGPSGMATYADLLRNAETIACAIAARVAPGRSVACVLPQTITGIAGILGCLIAARPCVILNPAEPAERLAALLAEARPAMMLVSTPRGFPQAETELLLDDVVAGPAAAWQPDQPWNPDTPFAIHYTSGSSGIPKGIALSARSTLYRALDAATTWGLTASDAVLVTALPSTGTGLSFLLAALHAGARFLIVNIGTEGISQVLRLAEREGVTCAASGPALWRTLFQVDPTARAFRTLRVMRIGNAALPKADLMAWRAALPPECLVLHTYASTEALVVAQWFVPADLADDQSTLAAGLLQSSLEYSIVDEEGKNVAPGAPGELILRGPLLALGEWQGGRLVPGRLPPVTDRPGWRSYRTGDVARLELNGMLRVLGRADRQVKINGVRVEPGEVEAVLRAEPGVVDAAVVTLTGAGQSTMHAFVTALGVPENELLASLRRRVTTALPWALRPASIRVLDALPLMPGGKIAYNALARMVEGS